MEFNLKVWFTALLFIFVILSETASAQQQAIEWNAIQSIGNERDCPTTVMGRRWHVQIRRGRMVAVSDRFTHLRVNVRDLNPDGSGRVEFMSKKGQPAWIQFDPGTGPRAFHYHIGYHACIFMLTPT